MDAGKKRRGAIAFSLAILAILVTRPATAEELGKVWTQFQLYMEGLQAYIDEQLPESSKPLDNSAELVTEAQGELGIPNPNQVRENARDRITPDSPADAFENNSIVRREGVSNELDRQITRSAIDSELGKDGQARTKELLEQTEETVDNIQSISARASNQTLPGNLQEIGGILQRIEGIAGAAESADNTQDVVKLLVRAQFEQSRVLRQAWFGQASLQADAIQAQSEQSKILGQMLSSSIGIHKDLQFSNLNLTNISQQMDAANRANRVEAAASAARFFKIASQTDLLLSYPQQPAN
ncbi:MAG TPA: hypothetical protein DDW76_34755 [Cyanobacteria bacterium UBA11369]|nr:hypothetical protein [Cyanobacteria bacterium UBA11371]HBE34714.1 hypothetical protein [Cyanobacteria bacterium UBA11368]HBE53773.1 hypothetical protein [Cyanobacteria bacterium UBA11369]